MSTKDLLDQIQVQKPCTADWNSMVGNDRIRFCEHCQLTVQDLSQMTRKHVLRLVKKSNGRLCVRYQRLPDRSLLTRSMPQKLFRISRRASRIAAGAFSATLSLASAAANPSTSGLNLDENSAATATQNPSRQVYLGGMITGTVTDSNGAVIPGAVISVSNSETKLALIISADTNGQYRFEGLEPGFYSLKVEAAGFDPADLGSVYLPANATQRADSKLEVATIREEVEVRAGREEIQGGMGIVIQPSAALVKAAQEDDVQEVLSLLTKTNVNLRDKPTGTTALEHAVRNGNREMLQALISAGADVNCLNESKETVLMMLGEESTSDIVWDLIHAGAKVNLKDEDGDTALIEAAMIKNLSVLTALLHAGAKVDERNDEGQTALMVAASENQVKNVKALIAAGADMNGRDKEGKTALNYAKEAGHEKIIKLLQSYGALEGEVSEKEP